MTSLLEISGVLLLIVVNGVFAMSEIAVVTARRARLERRAGQGDKRARAAAVLKDEPTEFLSAVQIGITLVGILAGAFGGARLAEDLAQPLARIDWLEPYANTTAFVLVVGGIAYLSLVIGELVPKRIALSNPEEVASRIARPMQRLATVARPLVALLSGSTNAVVRLIGIRPDDDPHVTEYDIRAVIAQGARAGVVHETEEDILERVFYLGDREVRAVMTPRPDVDWIDVDAPPAAIREAVLAGTHRSRLLVCDGDIDHVRGVVRATDLLARCLAGGRLDLATLLQDPHFVPVTMPLLQLLQQFRRSAVHFAVARDEDSSVQGVVTLNDLLTDLVAHVPGRVGHRDTDIVRRDDGSWLVDGTVPLEDVERALGTKVLPLAQERGSQTLGAFIPKELGREPREGDSLRLGGFRVEVMDMDGSRVDRVLVQRAEKEAEPTTPVV